MPRELREEFPTDWQARVRVIASSSPEPSASPHRLEIQADAEAIERIRAEFGGRLRIEARVPRTRRG